MKVWVISSEMWCSLATMETFFTDTILYNNTRIVWNNKTTKVAYEESKQLLETNVIGNITRTLDLDLGNFTTRWRHALLEVRFTVIIHIYYLREILVRMLCHLLKVFIINVMNISQD